MSLAVFILLAIGLHKPLEETICDLLTQRTVAWYKNDGVKVKRGHPRRSNFINSSTTQIA